MTRTLVVITEIIAIVLALTMASTIDDDVESRSFKAIKAIHKHLDHDQDGDVDLEESTETSTQVCDWISDIVNLPQYSKNFSEKKIDGRMLPRFTNEATSLYSVLGISNVKHRKKISLRATDIVLFGPPVKGYTKDIILGIVVTLMTLACYYALSEKKSAKKQIEHMMKDVEFMQLAEQNLKNTQEKLRNAELEHRSTILSKKEIEHKLKKEIETAKKEAERLHEERSHHEEERMKMSLVERELTEVRKALQKAEAEMDTKGPKSTRSLQQWLHLTYRKESKHFIAKKNNALKQMQDAKEACEKIRKKRGALFGSLRLVHGQTIDEVDQKILSARSALAEVTNELQERQHRWRQIEELCGFQIVCDGLLSQSLEIEDQSRRSSIARALAVCANLGGIGSIPGSDPSKPSTPRSNSKMATTSGASSGSMSKHHRDDWEFTDLYPGHHASDSNGHYFTSSNSMSSSGHQPVMNNSLLDKVEYRSSDIVGIEEEDSTFVTSAQTARGSVKDILGKDNVGVISPDKGIGGEQVARESMIARMSSADATIGHGRVSSRHSLSDVIDSTDAIHNKFHSSQSMPVFTSTKQFTEVTESPRVPHRSLSKVKAIHHQYLLRRMTDQVSNLAKCFGSNEELSTEKAKMGMLNKKQKLYKFSSIGPKKHQSFDETSNTRNNDLSGEQNKKKSILSKFRKK
eukprot:gene6879-7654_t